MAFPILAVAAAVGGLLLGGILSFAMAGRAQGAGRVERREFERPVVEEGRPLGVPFGTVWARDPLVMWFGDVSTEKVERKGGK